MEVQYVYNQLVHELEKDEADPLRLTLPLKEFLHMHMPYRASVSFRSANLHEPDALTKILGI